jgi:hypothetical protein
LPAWALLARPRLAVAMAAAIKCLMDIDVSVVGVEDVGQCSDVAGR